MSDLILFETLSRQPDQALAFIESTSKALVGFGGIKNPNQGKIAAITCITEKLSITDFMKKYHIIEGKLSHTAVYMHAEMENLGWDISWLKDGSNEQEASARFLHKTKGGGKDHTVTYTMDMAKKAGLVKPDGAWEKTPANMLRARVIGNAAVMLEPRIISGNAPDADYDESSSAGRSEPAVSETIVESVETKVVTEKPKSPVDSPAQTEVQAENEKVESDLANGPYDAIVYQQIRDFVARHKANEIAGEILKTSYASKPVKELKNLEMRQLAIELYAEVLGVSDKLPAAVEKVGCDDFRVNLTIAQANKLLALLQGIEGQQAK